MSLSRDEVVGQPTGTSMLTVERGPVTRFAEAVTESSPIYQRVDAAQAAGFEHIPVPPTFFFSAAGFWGTFAEQQPADDPTEGRNVITELVGSLMRSGGLILHGEQEFVYHRPIVVGETLRSEGRIADLYTKQSGERTMTFVVTETDYRDQSGELVLTTRMNLIHRS